ncbi:MAG: hypothetical protein H8E46_00915 [FCB group bacterium]|nr:hypothetical protein [FCB group bacterium]
MKFLTGIIILLTVLQVPAFVTPEAVAIERQITANLESLYNARKFDELITYGNSLLETPDTLYPDELSELRRYMGFTCVILRREYEAKNHFMKWLELDPEASLDPIMVPPNIIRVFYLAKGASDSIQPEYVPSLPVSADRWTVMKPILWRSLLVPGWGHYHAGERNKGIILMMADTGLIGGCVLSHLNYLGAKEDYYAETDIENINRVYDNYNNANRLRMGIAATYLIYYTVTQIDVFHLPDKDKNAFSLNFTPAPRQPHRTPVFFTTLITVAF